MDGAQDRVPGNCPFHGPCCLGGLQSTKWLYPFLLGGKQQAQKRPLAEVQPLASLLRLRPGRGKGSETIRVPPRITSN